MTNLKQLLSQDLDRFLSHPEAYGYTPLESGGFNALWVLEKEGRITKIMTMEDGGHVVSKLAHLTGTHRPACLPEIFDYAEHENICAVEMEKLTPYEMDEYTMDTLGETYDNQSTFFGASLIQTLSVLRAHAGRFLGLDLNTDSLMLRDKTYVLIDMFDRINPHHLPALNNALISASDDIKKRNIQ